MKSNINQTVRDSLCLGCGVCQDICPKHCIQIQKGRMNIPNVDENSCIECGLCRKVCSGLGIDINNRAIQLISDGSAKNNVFLGRFLNCYKGYSTEKEIRYHSAAGGCLSQFLVWLLEKGEIDGAVVTKFRDDAPMTPQTFIARSKEEILTGKSSKYCVVSMEGILTEIKKKPGRYVVVGLPCHIHAIRKCMDVDKTIGERIVGCFAIYCSSNKTMDSQRYLVYRYGVDKTKLKNFAYRDNGCLGSMYFRDGNGQNIVEPIYYLDYYLGMRAFFSVPRCGLCNDFFGELADVAFGDLNTGKKDDDPIGINSLIARTKRWDDLLKKCVEDGALHLETIDEETMVKAQGYCKAGKKGPGFYANMKVRKLLGKKVPEYDNLLDLKPGIKDYAKVFTSSVQRFIGKHEVLWPIIKKFDRNKKN